MVSRRFDNAGRLRERTRTHRYALHSAAITTLLLCGGLAPVARAQDSTSPVIASVWGDPADGQPLRVLGKGFGAHGLDIAAAVGTGGWIETNAKGTPIDELRGAAGWDMGQASRPPVITAERAHSGRHSVLARVDFAADGYWQSVLRYRHHEGFDRLYATFWVYFEPIALSPHRSTQWKFWRVNHNGTVSDQAGQVYLSSRHRDDGRLWDYQWLTHCALGCREGSMLDCYANAGPTPPYAPRFGDATQYRFLNRADQLPWELAHPDRGRWNRIEIELDRGTTDVADGSFTYRLLEPGAGIRFEETVEGLLLRRSEAECRNPQDPWQYVQWQNYWDDDGSQEAQLFQGERADFFYDDLYLQFGSVARIELGDASILRACTKREIQVPTSWEEKEIAFRLHRGGLETGQRAWIFVVDEYGNASPGMPITLR